MSETAAAYPIRLGGVDYLVSPLSDKDLAELDNYVRATHIRVAVESTKSFDAATQAQLRGYAIEQASSITFASEQGAKIMRSLEGIARMLWQGIKHNNPNITVEQVQSYLLDSDARSEANRIFRELNVKPLQEVAAAGKALAESQRRKSTKHSARTIKRRPKK